MRVHVHCSKLVDFNLMQKKHIFLSLTRETLVLTSILKREPEYSQRDGQDGPQRCQDIGCHHQQQRKPFPTIAVNFRNAVKNYSLVYLPIYQVIL